jgi:transcription-repair coupling factor (superfamily II helicase)
VSSHTSPLSGLATRIASEPGIEAIAGKRDGVIAVPEVARTSVLAALIAQTRRRPVVIATPTGTLAQSITDDLISFLGADNVEFFPSWETLPFERVSPAVHTMGSRMRTMWRLRQGADAPSVVVASTRALLQKLAPGSTTLEPIRVSVGTTIDIDALCEQLVHCGYRRETVVEHRGEFARRGAIVDIFPSTDDEPLRIDLWGDEVDRLTHFTVADQRSTDDLATSLIFPARELMYAPGIRERAESLLASEPWGREQWERLSEGQIFDGMESWMPWLTEHDELLTDHLGDDALIIMVEPRRMGERARDLLAEEDDLARALATSWARDENVTFPRLHVEADRLFNDGKRTATISVVPTAEVVDGPSVPASGWGPIVHEPTSFVRRVNEMLADCLRWSGMIFVNLCIILNKIISIHL